MGLIQYFKDTQAEMKHVNWPTRQQAIFYTLIIIIVCVGVSLFLGLFDYLFSIGIKKIIS